MKISIVTAYYNRRQLLINTLKSIGKTSHDDFEVIVVDDGSTEENKIGDLPNEFPFLLYYFYFLSEAISITKRYFTSLFSILS